MNILADAITFPTRGSGKYLLVTLAVLSIMADLASLAPGLGLIAWVLLFGYMCSVYFQIIQTTATGSREAPEFPETSNIIQDLLSPAAQIVAVLFVSFLPLMAAGFLMRGQEPSPILVYGLLGFGLFYAPMAVLAVAVLGSVGAMSPHIVFPSILRAGSKYLLVVVALGILYVAESLIAKLLGDQFIVRHLVMAVAGGFVMMANGRMLGILYREKCEELCWL